MNTASVECNFEFLEGPLNDCLRSKKICFKKVLSLVNTVDGSEASAKLDYFLFDNFSYVWLGVLMLKAYFLPGQTF